VLRRCAHARRTPYTDRVEALGGRDFSVVNHMLLPKSFRQSPEEAYWHLREQVQIWDVSCQRQVDIRGPDAGRLAQWMTPRNLSQAAVGDCLYAPLTDASGGLVNDPIALKLADDRWWLSIADSDVLLWALGLATGARLNVGVEEPDVSPLAIQGPRAEALMAAVFGDAIRRLRFFQFARFDFMGSRQVIARSGYSRQGGFEIYLDDSRLGAPLWDALWEAGQAFQIAPGCPNLAERIEGGLLSYGNEMTRDTNPLECNLAAFCDLSGAVDCIGMDALRTVAAAGITRQIRGLIIDGGPCPPCAWPWPVMSAAGGGQRLGQVTSAAYSPRLRATVALAMIARDFREPGRGVWVQSAAGVRQAVVSDLPFE